MQVNNLQQLLVEELKDLYDAEKQVSKALPKMVDKAENSALRKAFEDHLSQTRNQLRRLEEVFENLDVEDRQKECKGMQAIIEEGEEMVQKASDPTTRDAALIAAAQHVEHYEMAGYGTVVSYANQLDHDEVADQLQQSLNEESSRIYSKSDRGK
jgi:ferritin-like metal-binding protein YciE